MFIEGTTNAIIGKQTEQLHIDGVLFHTTQLVSGYLDQIAE